MIQISEEKMVEVLCKETNYQHIVEDKPFFEEGRLYEAIEGEEELFVMDKHGNKLVIAVDVTNSWEYDPNFTRYFEAFIPTFYTDEDERKLWQLKHQLGDMVYKRLKSAAWALRQLTFITKGELFTGEVTDVNIQKDTAVVTVSSYAGCNEYNHIDHRIPSDYLKDDAWVKKLREEQCLRVLAEDEAEREKEAALRKQQEQREKALLAELKAKYENKGN